MDEERDLIVVTDDEGNESELEILDYFEHLGKEYALLVDAALPDDAEDAEVYIMEIVPHDEDDTEEFVSIDDEVLFEELSGIAEEIMAQWDEESDEV